ncbi:hypothetical protein CerSpe_051300 [Prunus speciosa]
MEVEGCSNEAPHDVENPNTPVADSKPGSDSLSRRSPDECCIYRVPERLRDSRSKAYNPKVVSIGPFHHGNKHLEDMEEDKQRYLQYLLDRNGASLEDYEKKIKDQEEKLRGCYGNAMRLSSDQFVRIILVDTAFVIELLVRNFEDLQDDDDRIFKKRWMLTNILPDMLLLENQLPFFILKDLFDPSKVRVKNSEIGRPSIIKLSYHFFDKVVGLQKSEDQLNQPLQKSEISS